MPSVTLHRKRFAKPSMKSLKVHTRIYVLLVTDKIYITKSVELKNFTRPFAFILSFLFVGRGRKKMLKSMLPLLIAAKVKVGALATLAYLAIGLIAKKAIFASLISLAISAFIGLKALWSKKSDVTPYNGWNGGNVGWSAPVATGGWSSGGSWDDSHNYGQSQAYSGYHH